MFDIVQRGRRRALGAADLAEVKRRTDLASLVSEHVALRRSGRALVGLCPYHQEKTPSFRVDPEHGLFHCFGCDAGGDVFTFMMRVTGASFNEAVEHLAAAGGMQVRPGRRPGLAARLASRRRDETAINLELIDNGFAKTWNDAISAVDDARDRQKVLSVVERADSLLVPKGLRDSLGDPYLAEQLALEHVAALDERWRTWREASGYLRRDNWALRILNDEYTVGELDRGIEILAEIINGTEESRA